MSTTPAVRRLTTGILDDAAMFPPGNASPGEAVLGHMRHRSSWYADLVGPLLVPGDRWDELGRAHAVTGSPETAVVLVGTRRTPAPGGRGLRVVGYEAVAGEPPLALPDDGARFAAELGGAHRADAILDAVAESRASGVDVIAKYRTGGESAAAFPPEVEVARVVSSAVARGVPLKFTAGLHHALRHTDSATGLERHGFLNLMAAVWHARRGADAAELASVLATRDADAVVRLVGSWSVGDADAVRDTFVSFGCCGVEEPVADLARLGLVDEEQR